MENSLSIEALHSFLENGLAQAMERHQLQLSDSAQSYLKQMLEHFADIRYEDNWLQPITFQHQRITEQLGTLQRTKLQRELGDYCLFLVGYFYDFVRKNGEGVIEYHTSLGSAAYKQIGACPFGELSEKYADLYLVIGDLHLSQLDEEKTVSIYEKWLETGDRYYESLLLGKGITPKNIMNNRN